MVAVQVPVSENWDDDFEFQVEKRKMTTKSEATENWDDDFEDSRQSPKKIIQRHREESWDDEDDEDDDDDENSQFGLFSEDDRMVTARSRRAALAKLSIPGHPTSSVSSAPTTIRSFSDVDLPRPASALDSRRTSRSDLSIHKCPPLVTSAVAETSIGPPNGPVSIPHTPTKGAALLSRIGSFKKWGVRRKRGDSTAPTDAHESFVEREPIPKVTSKWDLRRRMRGDSSTPADTIPTGSRSQTDEDTTPSQSQSTSHLPTPRRGRRRGESIATTDVISNDLWNGPRLTPRASSSLSSYQQQHPLPPLPSPISPSLHNEASHPTHGVPEKEKEGHQKEKGKEGTRSFMGSVRRISLISVGVVGRHKKTKSGGGFVGVRGGGGSPVCIPPVPAMSCASQVSLKIPSSMNMAAGQRSSSSHTSTDLRRAASLSSPSRGGDSSGSPTAISAPAIPVRSNSSSRHSRRPSISSFTKRLPRTLSKSKFKSRKSEESSQDGGLKAGYDLQQEQALPCEEKDTTLLKTPTRSAPSTNVATIPLLPPIELQPPSPPRTTTNRIQKRSRAHTTNEVIEGLELETLIVTPSTSSLVFFTPTSSFSGSNVGVGTVGVGPLPPLSPSKLSPGKSPLQSQQSVSLGRSTTINVAGGDDEATGLSLAGGSGSGGGGGLPRRNSLGNLKIPARISQAQVGLRRDLGMVREFASNVEQLKELQNTYNTLVIEVRALLDTHAHLRQRVQLPPPPQPVEKSLSPASSPSFFTQLKSRPKFRARSDTVGSTTSHSPDVDLASLDVAVAASQLAYNRFVEAFWSINYRYRVSWECAELLIELGSGSGGGDGAGGAAISAPLSTATTSASAPAIQQHLAGAGGEGTIFNLKGRERAITLAGDESKHSTTPPLSPTVHHEPQTHCESQPSSAIVCTSSKTGGIHSDNATSNGSSPLASPHASRPSMSWRASTGRHDLSQRQLVLLREILNNNGDANIVGASDGEGGLGSPPHFLIPADEDLELRPSSASLYPSPYSQFVNRDWRWGDARNSTITFSEDQENGFGAEDERRERKMDKEKKRRSVKLGMGAIRDMLRSLKKVHKEELPNGNMNPGEVQSSQQCNHHLHGRLPTAVALAQPMMHSTTSLITESSFGSKNVHNQAQVHQQQNRLPISRIPSQIRRRGRSSTGPESMKSNKGPSPTSFNPPFFATPKPSPRRPSLASIFRIGNNKTRPAVLHTGVAIVDPATSSSTFSASEHNLSAVQRSSGTTGTGGEYRNSTGEEEEDWDRMNSPSDIDATAVKAFGIVDGAYDVSATIRGRGKVNTKANEKTGVSPYLQNQSLYKSDHHHPPPLPPSSSSTALGNFLARHSIIPKRSFSASQSSILGSAGDDGQQHSTNVPSCLSRHSNFKEQYSTDAADNVLPASLRISSSKSAPTTSQSKSPSINLSASSTPGSSSRPSSSRSTKFPNARKGSVPSTLPHLVPSSLVPCGLQGQQLSPLSPLQDPRLGMIMTPENIKPLLENAKEVHMKLNECIVEIRALIDNGAAAIGYTGVAQAPPT